MKLRDNTVAKCTIIRKIAAGCGVPYNDCWTLINRFFEECKAALENGQEVHVTNFGKFRIKVRKGRTRPPQMLRGREIRVVQKTSKYVKFKMSGGLKTRMNPPQDLEIQEINQNDISSGEDKRPLENPSAELQAHDGTVVPPAADMEGTAESLARIPPRNRVKGSD